MHRVDEDQRIDGDPLWIRARGEKCYFDEIAYGGGPLIGAGGGLIDTHLPRNQRQFPFPFSILSLTYHQRAALSVFSPRYGRWA